MLFRSWTNIALLVVIAIVLTVMLLLRPGDRLPPAPLTEQSPEATSAFSVEYADNRPTLRLERSADEGWMIVEPVRHAARDTRTVRVLSLLDDRIDSCYAASTRDLTEYALDEPAITLIVGDETISFGDRAADGRRHVLSGERLCLIDDFSYPILHAHLTGLAELTLLPQGSEPVRIETPAAAAHDPDGEGKWTFSEGEGAPMRWAARWRGARANEFVLNPPADDLGTVEIELKTGEIRQWRIAQVEGEEQNLILVPRDGQYGLRVPPDMANGLIEPPAFVEDGMN